MTGTYTFLLQLSTQSTQESQTISCMCSSRKKEKKKHIHNRKMKSGLCHITTSSFIQSLMSPELLSLPTSQVAAYIKVCPDS